MVRRKRAVPVLTASVPVRVRFSEVDSMRIVWHGEYVRYFEDVREAFGRQYPGLGYMDIYESGYTTPVVDIQLQFKSPLHYGETAVAEVGFVPSDAAKICFEYTIRRATNGEVVATGSTVQVFLNLEGVLELVNPPFYLKWKERWGVK